MAEKIDIVDLNFIEQTNEVLKPVYFPGRSADGMPWDMLFLGHFEEPVGGVLNASREDHKLSHSMGPSCTHGYAVTLKGAKKILQQIPGEFVVPIDYVYRDLVKNG